MASDLAEQLRLEAKYDTNSARAPKLVAAADRIEDLEAETELQKRHISALQAALDTRKAEVERLEAQLRVAKGFHDVAVAQRNAAWAEVERLRRLLRTLLGLHDAEVFVREPWDTTFDEVRAALGEVQDGD